MMKEMSIPKELLDDSAVARLERANLDGIRPLLRGAPSSKQTAKDYVQYFIFGGQPENAQSYLNSTGIKIDWDKEKDIVSYGYDAIVGRLQKFYSNSRIVSTVELNRIKLMRKVTGINVPDRQNDQIMDMIAEVPHRNLVRTLKRYVGIVGVRINQSSVNRIYMKCLHLENKPCRENLENSLSILRILNTRPTGMPRSKLIKSYVHISSYTNGSVRLLKNFEKYLPIFADPSDKQGIEKLIQGNVPDSEKLVLKLIKEGTLDKAETHELYLQTIRPYLLYTNKKLVIKNLRYLGKYNLEIPPEFSYQVKKLLSDKPRN